MNFSIELISAVLSGAVASGICISLGFLLFGKSITKSKKSKLAKELKQEKLINYITNNIKEINKHLQLETTSVAKSLDSFNNNEEKQELIENDIIRQRASRKELTEKDKKKVTKVKI
ncbi:hypothetical protein [Spiroplasma endosymbiont of Polydrusus pterygomalis]|uniref:hypothetical protein n=1 Tax=Spiroplasma endosymbiont of Polydrusus pterygomalis TaxID=3139327 RepID=UPI003CCB01F4